MKADKNKIIDYLHLTKIMIDNFSEKDKNYNEGKKVMCDELLSLFTKGHFDLK